MNTYMMFWGYIGIGKYTHCQDWGKGHESGHQTKRTHNPFDENYWASCLMENITSSSYGEGLETGH